MVCYALFMDKNRREVNGVFHVYFRIAAYRFLVRPILAVVAFFSRTVRDVFRRWKVLLREGKNRCFPLFHLESVCSKE
jgi:hypothetical protein